MLINRRTVMSGLLGGILVGIFGFGYFLNTKHHYRELETFFKGNVLDREIIAVSYFDYHGLGIFELNWWKIDLIGPHSEVVTIYQKQGSFQESVPHRPKIEIRGDQILIDDGEIKYSVKIQGEFRKGSVDNGNDSLTIESKPQKP